jgi:hypothetical protein
MILWMSINGSKFKSKNWNMFLFLILRHLFSKLGIDKMAGLFAITYFAFFCSNQIPNYQAACAWQLR